MEPPRPPKSPYPLPQRPGPASAPARTVRLLCDHMASSAAYVPASTSTVSPLLAITDATTKLDTARVDPMLLVAARQRPWHTPASPRWPARRTSNCCASTSSPDVNVFKPSYANKARGPWRVRRSYKGAHASVRATGTLRAIHNASHVTPTQNLLYCTGCTHRTSNRRSVVGLW